MEGERRSVTSAPGQREFGVKRNSFTSGHNGGQEWSGSYRDLLAENNRLTSKITTLENCKEEMHTRLKKELQTEQDNNKQLHIDIDEIRALHAKAEEEAAAFCQQLACTRQTLDAEKCEVASMKDRMCRLQDTIDARRRHRDTQATPDENSIPDRGWGVSLSLDLAATDLTEETETPDPSRAWILPFSRSCTKAEILAAIASPMLSPSCVGFAISSDKTDADSAEMRPNSERIPTSSVGPERSDPETEQQEVSVSQANCHLRNELDCAVGLIEEKCRHNDALRFECEQLQEQASSASGVELDITKTANAASQLLRQNAELRHRCMKLRTQVARAMEAEREVRTSDDIMYECERLRGVIEASMSTKQAAQIDCARALDDLQQKCVLLHTRVAQSIVIEHTACETLGENIQRLSERRNGQGAHEAASTSANSDKDNLLHLNHQLQFEREALHEQIASVLKFEQDERKSAADSSNRMEQECDFWNKRASRAEQAEKDAWLIQTQLRRESELDRIAEHLELEELTFVKEEFSAAKRSEQHACKNMEDELKKWRQKAHMAEALEQELTFVKEEFFAAKRSEQHACKNMEDELMKWRQKAHMVEALEQELSVEERSAQHANKNMEDELKRLKQKGHVVEALEQDELKLWKQKSHTAEVLEQDLYNYMHEELDKANHEYHTLESVGRTKLDNVEAELNLELFEARIVETREQECCNQMEKDLQLSMQQTHLCRTSEKDLLTRTEEEHNLLIQTLRAKEASEQELHKNMSWELTVIRQDARDAEISELELVENMKEEINYLEQECQAQRQEDHAAQASEHGICRTYRHELDEAKQKLLVSEISEQRVCQSVKEEFKLVKNEARHAEMSSLEAHNNAEHDLRRAQHGVRAAECSEKEVEMECQELRTSLEQHEEVVQLHHKKMELRIARLQGECEQHDAKVERCEQRADLVQMSLRNRMVSSETKCERAEEQRQEAETNCKILQQRVSALEKEFGVAAGSAQAGFQLHQLLRQQLEQAVGSAEEDLHRHRHQRRVFEQRTSTVTSPRSPRSSIQASPGLDMYQPKNQQELDHRMSIASSPEGTFHQQKPHLDPQPGASPAFSPVSDLRPRKSTSDLERRASSKLGTPENAPVERYEKRASKREQQDVWF